MKILAKAGLDISQRLEPGAYFWPLFFMSVDNVNADSRTCLTLDTIPETLINAEIWTDNQKMILIPFQSEEAA